MTENSEGNKRRQLTLFLSESESLEIENCRKTFNIEQYKIIKCHVTLCREDEIEEIEKIKVNLKNLNFDSFNLELGKPIQFSDDKGVLIPVVGNDLKFQNLRTKILNGISRNHKPHITIMHPRNSSCTNEIFETISKLKFPIQLKFSRISLIEQNFAGSWSIVDEYELNN